MDLFVLKMDVGLIQLIVKSEQIALILLLVSKTGILIRFYTCTGGAGVEAW